MKQGAHYKEQARVLKALANETRLKIVHRLGRGECRVGELGRTVGADQSTVSKHLAILRGVGVVEDERRGNTVIYRLVTPCVIKFFACASQVLRECR
jgi:DNA-binding transcriptional ArsR family regulator